MVGIIIGIIGVIITLMLGVYSIKLSKKQKETKSLSFKKNECFSLFDSAIENLQIDIKYRNKSIKNVLIILRAEIVNSGTTDIDKTSIYKPIKLITNENYLWLEIKHKNYYADINATINRVNEKEISIEWDLLKKGEKIIFEALIEGKKREDFSDNNLYSFDFIETLKFQSRITGLDKIDTEDGHSRSLFYLKKRVKHNIIVYSLIGIFGLLMSLSPQLTGLYNFNNLSFDVFYKISLNKNDSAAIYKIVPVDKNTLILKNNEFSLNKISVRNFNKNYSLIKIKDIKENYPWIAITLLIGGFLLLFVSIFVISNNVIEFYYQNKIYKKPKR